MKKVTLLSNAEMKNILGGNEPEAKVCHEDGRLCDFWGPGGVAIFGECGYSTNRTQCRCIADGSSVPLDLCKAD